MLIHARFEAQALRSPEALAISSDQGAISYGELDHLSRGLAAQLAADPAASGMVAILAERRAETIVTALACARAGRPFAILDLAYPATRLRTLLEICRPSTLVTAGQVDPATISDLPAIPVELGSSPGRDGADLTGRDVSPDAPAYLLFTSGSTGTPKCVACSHRPLVNFVAWQSLTFGLGPADRFSFLSGLSHDPILRDIFTPLSLGASIHIPSQATLTAPGGLHAWFAETRPTAAHMTPPLGHLLTAVRGGAARLPDLRHVFWGGDVLRYPLVQAVAELAPGCESVNFYGSTETPQAASFFRARPGVAEGRVPIGTGVDGFELEIRGEDGRTMPDGEAGEIVVRSPFLTLGYVVEGRLPDARESAPAYATGDIGVRGPDGQVSIQGRRDDQVKVRGYRVEMPEITACALARREVGQAVTLNVGSPESARLCCFVEPFRRGAQDDAEALRAHFAANLPAYMVPDEIAVLDALPLLPNGKVDRQALLATQRAPQPAAPQPDRTLSATETGLLSAWRGLFGADRVTLNSSFASLGGDSLSYVNAYLSAEEALGAVPDGWITLTVAELAATRKADARRSAFVAVESAIVMRALAITTVVASHFGLLFSGGAATSALIWISGFLFGQLQLHEVDHQASSKPIGRVLRSLLLPLFAYEAVITAAKLATHRGVELSSLFLYTDLLDYTGLPNRGPNAYGGHDFLMWYVHCIVHILLLFAAIVFLCTTVFKVRRSALVSLVAAVALGLFGRFVLPMIFVPGFWSKPVDPMSFFNHAPTAHFATFALAALAGFLRGRQRFATLAGALGYALLSTPLYGPIDAAAITAVACVLLFVPKLIAPRFLSLPIYLVAGASFFIYLLHFKALMVARFLHLPAIVAWPAAVGGGVAAWSAWNWVTHKFGQVRGALRTVIGPKVSGVATLA